MSTYSEYTIEFLNCVDSNKESNKYIYQYKYYGNAHGILNIYVPNCVNYVIIQSDENFYQCQLIKSMIDYNYKLVLCNECKNIDFTQIKKFSLTVYANNIKPPKIKINCEYIFNKKSNSTNINLGYSPSSLPNNKFSRSKPKNISGNSSNNSHQLIFMMSPSSHSGE